jgi:hypothetical protein
VHQMNPQLVEQAVEHLAGRRGEDGGE